MGNTFKNMGHLKAVSELENEMEGNTPSIHSPLKPFSLKVPQHVLESLDFLAESMSISRSALIVNIFDQYLGQVTYDYLDGYHGFMPTESPAEVVVSEDLDVRLENSDLSESAKQYLKDGVYNVAFGM
jgi:hypothetical protein